MLMWLLITIPSVTTPEPMVLILAAEDLARWVMRPSPTTRWMAMDLPVSVESWIAAKPQRSRGTQFKIVPVPEFPFLAVRHLFKTILLILMVPVESALVLEAVMLFLETTFSTTPILAFTLVEDQVRRSETQLQAMVPMVST